MSLQLTTSHLQGCFESDENGVARVARDCPALLWVIGSAQARAFAVEAAFDISSCASSTEVAMWRSRVEAGLPEGHSILGIFCRQGSSEEKGDEAPTLPKHLMERSQGEPLLVFGEASNGNLCAWRFANIAEPLMPWRMVTGPLTFARGRLVTRLSPAPPTQMASELERQAAAFHDSLHFVFAGSSMALKLTELENENLPIAVSTISRGVVEVEILSEALSSMVCRGPANFLEQDASPPIEYAFDFIALVDLLDVGAATIAKALITAAQRQVAAAAGILRGSKSIAPPVAFRCFRLQSHSDNLMIALAGTDDAETRSTLHKILRLPQVPLLQPECALPWGSIVHPCSTGKPINPHLDCGQKPGWWKGGEETKTAFIRGMYEYCHYMQDQFNDNGWGCAYRSLQTCVSWYRMQFYSTKDVPGIVEIQELLKRIDEAHKDIKVGGKTWIGTVEGMHVLQDYLGVECILEFCTDVDDMANKVPNFLQHFAVQGTPIMMGVGQEAFTMVGLCYDGASGEVGFLIVDPHYTGVDELKKILDKGWVGWKNLDFFRKKADGNFINCCLPKVPHTL